MIRTVPCFGDCTIKNDELDSAPSLARLSAIIFVRQEMLERAEKEGTKASLIWTRPRERSVFN
jgi:hypothetical protein